MWYGWLLIRGIWQQPAEVRGSTLEECHKKSDAYEKKHSASDRILLTAGKHPSEVKRSKR